MNDRPTESWRQRAAVSEALEVFNSSYLQEVWSKALARREKDPEGAVTSARTLLEVVCKHILESANKSVREGLPLPLLYKETAKLLEIAPNDNLALVLNTLFTGCADVIESVGKLRNELGDSHGRGPFGAMPTWRHAELAVNLSGAMATYLAAVWKGRQPSVSDVIREWLSLAEREGNVRSPLEKLAGSFEEVVATKLRASELMAYFDDRAKKDGISPATITKEFGLFQRALGGTSSAAFVEAAQFLKKTGVMGSTQDPRLRRVAQADVETVLDYLREQARESPGRKHLDVPEGIVDIVEFAIGSGRKLADIFRLRWCDVDFQKQTCKLPGDSEPFPVLGKAWQLIQERRPDSITQTAKVFPEHQQAVRARHQKAVDILVEAGKLKVSHRFPDYRYEGTYRLLEKGYPAGQVAQATGQASDRVIKMENEVRAASDSDRGQYRG